LVLLAPYNKASDHTKHKELEVLKSL